MLTKMTMVSMVNTVAAVGTTLAIIIMEAVTETITTHNAAGSWQSLTAHVWHAVAG